MRRGVGRTVPLGLAHQCVSFWLAPGVVRPQWQQRHQFAQQLDHRVDTFDDYLALLEVLLDTLAERHQVGLKNALAYDRSVDFDDVDEDLRVRRGDEGIRRRISAKPLGTSSWIGCADWPVSATCRFRCISVRRRSEVHIRSRRLG